MSTYSGYSPDTAGLRSDVSDLQDQVENLEELPGQLDTLREEVRELERWREEAEDQIRDLETETGDSDGQIESLQSAVDRLATRLTWLENHLKASGTVTEVSLDLTDAETRRQAEAIRESRHAAEDVLAAYERKVLKLNVDQFKRALDNVQAADKTIRASVEQLAGTHRTDPEHAKAAEDFRRATTALNTAMNSAKALKPHHDKAAAELAADDEARRAITGYLSAGAKAQTALTTRLRTRLVNALGERAMLPVWFTAVFGPTIPATGGEDWLDAATQTLLYRAVYEVDDRALALGPAPAADEAPHQITAHEELTTRLKRIAP